MSTLRIRLDNRTIRELKIPKENLEVFKVCDIHQTTIRAHLPYIYCNPFSLCCKRSQKIYFFDMNTL
jgi:hypothetical protein